MYQEYICTYKLNDKCNNKNNANDNQQYSFINFSVSMQTMICLQLMYY